MKRASFWLKAAAAAALTAALGAVALVVALRSFFPEPKLRAMTVDAAKRQLGRDVRLEGIGLGLTGLSLRGLEVSESPDFSAGTFVRVESFRLRPSWRALLKRRLVVAAVSADGLTVRVVKGGDGRFNFETLMSSAPSAPPAKAAPGAPAPELDVRAARIARGRIEFADRTTGAAWTVSDLDLGVKGFAVSAPFDLDVSARVQGKAGARPVDARVAYEGTVDLARMDRAAFRAAARRFSVEAEGVKLRGSVEVAGLDAPKVSFKADVSAAGQDLLHAEGTASAGDVLSADVKARTPGLDTGWIAKLVPSAGIPAVSLPAADLTLSARKAGDRVEVKAFDASWKGGSVKGSGTADGLGGASPRFAGKASFGLDVPEIRPGQYPFLRLPPKTFVPATRLDGAATFSGDEVRLEGVKAAFQGGTVTVGGTVRRLGTAKPDPQVTAALALDLPSFKVSDLPAALPPSVPPALVVPALRLDGAVKVSGDDVRFEKLVVKGKGGRVTLDGTVAKALAGAPVPDVTVDADLDLPALTDKDLPFPGVPAGLETPPAKAALSAEYSPRLLKVKSLRLAAGKNDLSLTGTVSDPGGRNAFDLVLKSHLPSLEELTRLTPATRDMKLAGGALLGFSITGTKEKPVFAGVARFKGVGATVAELPFSDFTGTVSFDDRRVDVPNLTGKVGDGTLKMDLTVKDYARAPEIQLDADLDSFDLGRWLAVKNKVQAERKAARPAEPGGAESKPVPFSTRGHFNVGRLTHPNATVEDVKASWDLRDVTPDLAGLTGDARLHAGGGRLRDLQDLALKSKVMKVLSYPLRAIAIGNLNLIALNQYTGDFLFKDGLMTLRQSVIDMDKGQVSTTGTIDLPREALDLLVVSQLGRLAPVETSVTGTMSAPKTKTNVAKFLATPLRQLLDAAQKKDE